MHPVENRNDSDCGIAAICNVSGIDYATVRKHLKRKTIRGGMCDDEIVQVAKSLGLAIRRIAHRRPLLKDFCRKHTVGKFLVIVRVGATDYHAVGIVSGLAINARRRLQCKVDAVWKVGNDPR